MSEQYQVGDFPCPNCGGWHGNHQEWCGKYRFEWYPPHYQMQMFPAPRLPWTCPKCGRVYGPDFLGPCPCSIPATPPQGQPTTKEGGKQDGH